MLLFLYGPPGVGKSTLGRALARALDLPFEDLDARIEEDAGRSIPRIFAEEGEGAFREREARALADVVARYRGTRGAVVALGGGALLRAENRALAEAHGPVLCLTAKPETLQARMAREPEARPLVPGGSARALAELLRQRAAHYASFPRRLAVDGVSPDDLVWQAQVALGAFRLRAMPPAYDVRVRSGLLEALGEVLPAYARDTTSWALVSDARVMVLYGPQVTRGLAKTGGPVFPHTLPEGEQAKTLTHLQRLWEGFLQAGLDRRSTVVALGGGVVGDVAGFAAATFMRGVAWLNLPTSLLAMVDASIGGKTGIDLPQAKNAVGAFHPPRAVLVDPEVLRTLPEEHWRYGLAEAAKHGLIGDPALWADLARGMGYVRSHPEEVVRRALAVKVRVVEQDPWERTGRRAQLNAGHTVGHAIEAALGYAYPHGAAVAVGLVVEAALAEALGLALPGWGKEVARVLAGLGLPTRVPPRVSWSAFHRSLWHDKKRRAGRVAFALPVAVGRVVTGVHVPERVLERVFRQLQDT